MGGMTSTGPIGRVGLPAFTDAMGEQGQYTMGGGPNDIYGGMSPGDALGGGLTQTDPATGMPRGQVNGSLLGPNEQAYNMYFDQMYKPGMDSDMLREQFRAMSPEQQASYATPGNKYASYGIAQPGVGKLDSPEEMREQFRAQSPEFLATARPMPGSVGQLGITAPQAQQQGLVKQGIPQPVVPTAPGPVGAQQVAAQMVRQPAQDRFNAYTNSLLGDGSSIYKPNFANQPPATPVAAQQPPPPSAGNPQPISNNTQPYVGNLPNNTLPTTGQSSQQIQQQLAQPMGGTSQVRKPVNQMTYEQTLQRLGLAIPAQNRLASPGPAVPQQTQALQAQLRQPVQQRQPVQPQSFQPTRNPYGFNQQAAAAQQAKFNYRNVVPSGGLRPAQSPTRPVYRAPVQRRR
jgi:hypothetical protein